MADGSNTVASAPKVKPLTREQRKEKFAHIREKMRVSPLKVTGEPHKAYYWARKDDETEMARLNYLGFTVVNDPDGKVKASGKRQDGTYIMGDVILMEIDKELYEYFKDENLERAENLIASAKEDFIGESAKQGVPTFERGEKGGAAGVKTVFVPQT